MVRITIWDMDWYHRHSYIPNPKAMKISSFHKQQDHYINFVEKKRDLNFSYDIMYIIRERSDTPFPPGKYVDKLDVKMIGPEFEFYDNWWETTAAVDMCRPDYTLYPIKEKSPYGNAHVIQFLHKGKYLNKKQNYINSADKYHQKSLVVDEGLWDLDKNIFLKILEELKGLKNIAFSKPISLNYILSDEEITEKFLNLHYSAGTYFEFVNNLGQDFKSISRVIDFMHKFRKKHRVKLKGISVDSVYYDHWEKRENGILDLERLLKITNHAKKKEVKVWINTPYERSDSPHWIFFDILDVWSRYSYTESFIETMLRSTAQRHSVKWYEVLNDPYKWSTPRADILLYLLNSYPKMVLKYGGRKWGNKFTDISKIDWKAVSKYTDYRLRNKTLKNIENTLAEITAGG